MLGVEQQAIMVRFAENIKAAVRQAILTKSVTSFGAVNASGKLHDSIEIVFKENGFQILAASHIQYLIFGRRPGRFPPISAIKSWILSKGIQSELPIDSLAFLIARKISQEGNLIFRTHRGADSGLLSEAITDGKIAIFTDEITSSTLDTLVVDIVNTFQRLNFA